eukprot:60383_1
MATDYNSLKVVELRSECEKRGLESGGLKTVLIQRLTGSDAVPADMETVNDEEPPASKKRKLDDSSAIEVDVSGEQDVTEETPAAVDETATETPAVANDDEDDDESAMLSEDDDVEVTAEVVESLIENLEKDEVVELAQKLALENLESPVLLEAYQKEQSNPEQCRIFVRNLPFTLTQDVMKELFAVHGKVTEAIVINERGTRKSKGFGFVTFAKKKYAQAILALGHLSHGDRDLQVSKADPRPKKRSYAERGDDRPPPRRAHYSPPRRDPPRYSERAARPNPYVDRYAAPVQPRYEERYDRRDRYDDRYERRQPSYSTPYDDPYADRHPPADRYGGGGDRYESGADRYSERRPQTDRYAYDYRR